MADSGRDAGFAVPADGMRTTPDKAALTLKLAHLWLCMGAAMHLGSGGACSGPVNSSKALAELLESLNGTHADHFCLFTVGGCSPGPGIGVGEVGAHGQHDVIAPRLVGNPLALEHKGIHALVHIHLLQASVVLCMCDCQQAACMWSSWF